MKEIIYTLAAIAVAGVLATLVCGAFILTKEGENYRRLSNKLMKLRVILQAVTILLLGLAALVSIQ